MLAALWHTAFLVAMMPVVTLRHVYHEVVDQGEEDNSELARPDPMEDLHQQLLNLREQLNRLQAQLALEGRLPG